MAIYHILKNGHRGLAGSACLLGGVLWGAYWIPLRHLEAAGFVGTLGTGLIHVIPALLLMPVMLFRYRSIFRGGIALQATGAVMGLALLLYSTAFLYTDVIRATLGLSADRWIVCGLSIGHPDPAAVVNTFVPERLPLVDFVDWQQ